MKLKKGFVLREVAGETVVVPVEAELKFNGMITLNEAAKVLWNVLENETSTSVDLYMNNIHVRWEWGNGINGNNFFFYPAK